MSQDQIVCNNVRLSGRVSGSAVSVWLGAPPWGEKPIIIAKSSDDSWLVKSRPVLYSVSVRLETEVGVVRKVLPGRGHSHTNKQARKQCVVGLGDA